MTEATNLEEIGRRAYMLWEQEGRPHGKDWEHWFKAESEFLAETAALTTGAGDPKKKPAVRPKTGRRAAPKTGARGGSGKKLG